MAVVGQRYDTKLPNRMCAEYTGPSTSRQQHEAIVRMMLTIHFSDRRVSFKLKPLQGGSPELDSLAGQVTERVIRLTEKYSKGDKKMPTIEDFIREKWIIHAGNLNSEFSNVVSELFLDSVNWGRITALLQFSKTYCSYAIHSGLPESVIESVCGWTVLVLENDLHHWFRDHSWEEYITYADKRLSLPQDVNGLTDGSGWKKVATTAGAFTLGVAIAFVVKNAFS